MSESVLFNNWSYLNILLHIKLCSSVSSSLNEHFEFIMRIRDWHDISAVKCFISCLSQNHVHNSLWFSSYSLQERWCNYSFHSYWDIPNLKYFCQQSVKRSLSEMTLERVSSLFGSFSVLPSIAGTRGIEATDTLSFRHCDVSLFLLTFCLIVYCSWTFV